MNIIAFFPPSAVLHRIERDESAGVNLRCLYCWTTECGEAKFKLLVM